MEPSGADPICLPVPGPAPDEALLNRPLEAIPMVVPNAELTAGRGRRRAEDPRTTRLLPRGGIPCRCWPSLSPKARLSASLNRRRGEAATMVGCVWTMRRLREDRIHVRVWVPASTSVHTAGAVASGKQKHFQMGMEYDDAQARSPKKGRSNHKGRADVFILSSESLCFVSTGSCPRYKSLPPRYASVSENKCCYLPGFESLGRVECGASEEGKESMPSEVSVNERVARGSSVDAETSQVFVDNREKILQEHRPPVRHP